jgi:hypothetical protein
MKKTVEKICNPFELLFRMREKYISKHSSAGNSSSSFKLVVVGHLTLDRAWLNLYTA